MKKFNKAFAIYIIVTMVYMIINCYIIDLIPAGSIYEEPVINNNLFNKISTYIFLIGYLNMILIIPISIYSAIKNKKILLRIISLCLIILLPSFFWIDAKISAIDGMLVYFILNCILSISFLRLNSSEENGNLTKFQNIFIKFTYLMYVIYAIATCAYLCNRIIGLIKRNEEIERIQNWNWIDARMK